MKLLEKERVVARKVPHARTSRVIAAPRAIATPAVTVRARVTTRPLSRPSLGLELLLGRIVAFAAVLGMTYVGSTLAGYVALERARQATRHSEMRASYARSEAKAARASIEALTNPSVLRAWADAHGFVPLHNEPAPALDAPKGSGYVARR